MTLTARTEKQRGTMGAKKTRGRGGEKMCRSEEWGRGNPPGEIHAKTFEVQWGRGDGLRCRDQEPSPEKEKGEKLPPPLGRQLRYTSEAMVQTRLFV